MGVWGLALRNFFRINALQNVGKHLFLKQIFKKWRKMENTVLQYGVYQFSLLIFQDKDTGSYT